MQLLDEYRKYVAYFHHRLTQEQHPSGFSHQGRTVRYQAIEGLVRGMNVLDYGCGVGGLFEYLQRVDHKWGMQGRYLGIDSDEHYIEVASKRFAGNPGQFRVGDLLLDSDTVGQWQAVVASGLLCYGSNIDSAPIHRELVRRLWSKTDRVLVFNCLLAGKGVAELMRVYRPEDWIDFIRETGCTKYRILCDYYPNDFTVAMYR